MCRGPGDQGCRHVHKHRPGCENRLSIDEGSIPTLAASASRLIVPKITHITLSRGGRGDPVTLLFPPSLPPAPSARVLLSLGLAFVKRLLLISHESFSLLSVHAPSWTTCPRLVEATVRHVFPVVLDAQAQNGCRTALSAPNLLKSRTRWVTCLLVFSRLQAAPVCLIGRKHCSLHFVRHPSRINASVKVGGSL